MSSAPSCAICAVERTNTNNNISQPASQSASSSQRQKLVWGGEFCSQIVCHCRANLLHFCPNLTLYPSLSLSCKFNPVRLDPCSRLQSSCNCCRQRLTSWLACSPSRRRLAAVGAGEWRRRRALDSHLCAKRALRTSLLATVSHRYRR